MLNSAIIECYANYMAQLFQEPPCLRTASQHYPDIANSIVEGFLQKFDLSGITHHSVWPTLEDVKESYWKEAFKIFIELIESTVRTNLYCPHRQTLAIKLIRYCPELGGDLIELFVDHDLFQGILLKHGSIARGGVRWSDRQDFRTECFQLVKTQVVKNFIIVPSGAKGAFFLKNISSHLSPNRQQALECYKLFVGSILDLSDNWKEGIIVSPPGVRCYDEPDFYNVVAADKGTALFSDEANALACQRGYWLGDAFASGGSQGYNHKSLAITSRGVWISVRHHFGKERFSSDCPITAVGIGDMAGDLFGNGMLGEPHLKLLAAFNHDHIFIDPSPDPEASFQERKRLFQLPYSSWADYQAFSQGGGIFSRKASLLSLSAEATALLGLPEQETSPETVIQHILKLPVDLLWMGGIGTFVQGQNEKNVSDSFNEKVRIYGHQVRARVVGEGANLGFTQQGRVEYALAGGKINIDAVDNSAGVNCSDHEVNIKILLSMVVQQGKLSEEERNELLQEITDEVCHLVLKENAWQNIVISFAQQQSDHSSFFRFMRTLSQEYPSSDPDLKAIECRLEQGHILTRPEISVLIAHSGAYLKKVLKEGLLENKGREEVKAYFPSKIQERFADFIPHHLLYKAIKRTVLSNTLMHLCGPTLIHELTNELHISFQETVQKVLEFYEAFEGRRLEQKLEALFTNPKQIYRLLENFQGLLVSAVKYSHRSGLRLETIRADYQRSENIKNLYEAYEESLACLSG